VRAVWRARLDEHLGYTRSRARDCARPPCWRRSHAVYGRDASGSLARLLPERDPHEDIYEMLERTLDELSTTSAKPRYIWVKFRLAMLAELGFGLVLETCAATAGPPS